MGDGDLISVVLESPAGTGPLRIAYADDPQQLPNDSASIGFADVRPDTSQLVVERMPWRGVNLAKLTVDRGNSA